MLKIFPHLEISDNSKDDHYNVFLHIDFDHWEPDIVDDLRKKNVRLKGLFQSHRMIPRGISYYFYSSMGKAFVNPHENTMKINEYIKSEIKHALIPENRFNVGINDFDLDCLNFFDT